MYTSDVQSIIADYADDIEEIAYKGCRLDELMIDDQPDTVVGDLARLANTTM